MSGEVDQWAVSVQLDPWKHLQEQSRRGIVT